MMFKSVIFDWSGVVKDAVDAHLWVVNRMLEELGGKEITLEELKENWEQPYMIFWGKYFPDLTLEKEQELYFKTIVRTDCPKSNSYNGITAFIKKLYNGGAGLFVLSSDPKETIFPEIMEYDLENHFKEVVFKIHDKYESLEELMRKHNLKKEETVFIGDSNHEIEAGKKAGIKTIAVTWGFCTEDKLKGLNPDYLVHNIKELEEILL